MAAHYEIVIKGDKSSLRAYLEGYFIGNGVVGGHVFTEEERHFNFANIVSRIKHHGETVHIICNTKVRDIIRAAIKKAPATYKFEIVETHKVVRGYFEFKFETANRQVAGRIKRIFNNLPAGLRTTDYDPEEIINPDAKGAEGYAPLHPYVFKGKGVVEGDPAALYHFRNKCEDNEHIDADDIEIHH